MSDLAGRLPACLTAACSACVCVCMCMLCMSASLGAPVMTHVVTGGMLGVETGRLEEGGREGRRSRLAKLFVSSAPRHATPGLAHPSFTRSHTAVGTVRCS